MKIVVDYVTQLPTVAGCQPDPTTGAITNLEEYKNFDKDDYLCSPDTGAFVRLGKAPNNLWSEKDAAGYPIGRSFYYYKAPEGATGVTKGLPEYDTWIDIGVTGVEGPRGPRGNVGPPGHGWGGTRLQHGNGGGFLETDLTVSVDVGGLHAADKVTYPAGTPVEDVIMAMLMPVKRARIIAHVAVLVKYSDKTSGANYDGTIEMFTEVKYDDLACKVDYNPGNIANATSGYVPILDKATSVIVKDLGANKIIAQATRANQFKYESDRRSLKNFLVPTYAANKNQKLVIKSNTKIETKLIAKPSTADYLNAAGTKDFIKEVEDARHRAEISTPIVHTKTFTARYRWWWMTGDLPSDWETHWSHTGTNEHFYVGWMNAVAFGRNANYTITNIPGTTKYTFLVPLITNGVTEDTAIVKFYDTVQHMAAALSYVKTVTRHVGSTDIKYMVFVFDVAEGYIDNRKLELQCVKL